MNESFLQKAEEIFHQAAIKLSLEVVSIKNYNDPEMGKVLEVLLDHDYNITMEEIEAFTDMVNPLLDEIADDDKEGYILDIASGASEKDSFRKAFFLCRAVARCQIEGKRGSQDVILR